MTRAEIYKLSVDERRVLSRFLFVMDKYGKTNQVIDPYERGAQQLLSKEIFVKTVDPSDFLNSLFKREMLELFPEIGITDFKKSHTRDQLIDWCLKEHYHEIQECAAKHTTVHLSQERVGSPMSAKMILDELYQSENSRNKQEYDSRDALTFESNHSSYQSEQSSSVDDAVTWVKIGVIAFFAILVIILVTSIARLS